MSGLTVSAPNLPRRVRTLETQVKRIDQTIKQLSVVCRFELRLYEDTTTIIQTIRKLPPTSQLFFRSSHDEFNELIRDFQKKELGIKGSESWKSLALDEGVKAGISGAGLAAAIVGGALAPVTMGITAVAIPVVAFIVLESAQIGYQVGKLCYQKHKQSGKQKKAKKLSKTLANNGPGIQRTEEQEINQFMLDPEKVLKSMAPRVCFSALQIFKNHVDYLEEESTKKLSKAWLHLYFRAILKNGLTENERDNSNPEDVINKAFPEKKELKSYKIKFITNQVIPIPIKDCSFEKLFIRAGISYPKSDGELIYKSCYESKRFESERIPRGQSYSKAHKYGYLHFIDQNRARAYQQLKAKSLTGDKDSITVRWFEDQTPFWQTTPLQKDFACGDTSFQCHHTQGYRGGGLHALAEKQYYGRRMFKKKDFLGLAAKKKFSKKLEQCDNTSADETINNYLRMLVKSLYLQPENRIKAYYQNAQLVFKLNDPSEPYALFHVDFEHVLNHGSDAAAEQELNAFVKTKAVRAGLFEAIRKPEFHIWGEELRLAALAHSLSITLFEKTNEQVSETYTMDFRSDPKAESDIRYIYREKDLFYYCTPIAS